LEEWEKQAILGFYREYPQEGYRRLAFMMLDADVVAVSPSSVYRVLSEAGLLIRWARRVSKKGTGFVQPMKPHEHWHVDVAYLNLGGTFFYLCSVLDGFCRAIVHWEVKASMTEREVELVLQRAREKYPHEHPRIISDNGPQFIARDFKEFIREVGLTHVRISPGYPQSNGKLERYHRTLKEEGIRPRAPRTEEEANAVVEQFVRYYNEVRLHSTIGYITPADKLAGQAEEIFAARDRKLEAARRLRAESRQRRRAQKILEVAASTTLVA
jgi:transposase InsO family protein